METINVVVQLLDWSEGKRGRKIVLEIMDEGAGDHPFKQYTARNGKIAGQLFGAAFVEIDPSTEQPVEEQHRSWDSLTYKQRAGMLCRDSKFMEYMHTDNEEKARQALCDWCRVSSRAQIDDDQNAKDRFDTMHSSFVNWKARLSRAATLGRK